MSLPLLTIGTLSYNTGHYVIEALDCVKQQGYPNIQHIIIDDCSQDDSVQVIEEWLLVNNYSCTFIKHIVNKGVQFGLQEIFNLAQGKYLVMISDDLWLDATLIKRVNMFEDLDESYALIYGDTKMIDKDRKVLKDSMFENYRGKDFIPPSGNIFKEVVRDFYFFIQASMISLAHFRKLNYEFNTEIISEDWDWQLGLSRNFNILGVREVYGWYRYHEASIGRTTWTEARIFKVWKSQAKMLLQYYNHPKNTKEDKDLIFQRVWKYYKLLTSRSDFSIKDKKEFLKNMYGITHRFELYILRMSLMFPSFERYLLWVLRFK
ncbi:glycosyltransferase [Aquiflexum sp. TKW24L]|uniref:glycosyltransferase family 2 protein n=1 Tax=Aquiflexum sp. TKW24L TaxID=2942212 RepID=UPI0020C0826B|nr:glycosyltransferase [Aquiflexum sp. TKW24L]MCL6261238.1 glycosyltransferase [Aquiflexum sp. TKW24L]